HRRDRPVGLHRLRQHPPGRRGVRLPRPQGLPPHLLVAHRRRRAVLRDDPRDRLRRTLAGAHGRGPRVGDGGRDHRLPGRRGPGPSVIAALMGIVTGLNGFYVAGSRVLLALGRAQMIPRVFQRVHPRFGTPHYGILFVMLVSFIAPWFGRTALSWIVDMASIGFTFAFLYTSASAYRMLRWSGQGDRAGIEGSASTWRKLAAAAGVVIAIAFILLLLVPGSPAQLSVPSFIAMGAWIVIGAVFFAARRSHNKTLTDEQVD